MVDWTARSSSKPLRKRSVTRSQLRHRSGQHRVGRRARGQRAQNRVAQQQNLREKFGARLIDVAMDQVLQAAGLVLEQRQDLVQFAHLPDVVPGRAEHRDAVPYHRDKHDDDGRVQGGDRQNTPADRYRAQQPDDAGPALCGEARRPFRSLVLPGCFHDHFTLPCGPVGPVPRRWPALQTPDVGNGTPRSGRCAEPNGRMNPTPGHQGRRIGDRYGPRKVGAALHWQVHSPMMGSMAGKKGSMQFDGSRPNVAILPAPWSPARARHAPCHWLEIPRRSCMRCRTCRTLKRFRHGVPTRRDGCRSHSTSRAAMGCRRRTPIRS